MAFSWGKLTIPVISYGCTSHSLVDDSGLGLDTESQARTSLNKKFGKANLDYSEFKQEMEDWSWFKLVG